MWDKCNVIEQMYCIYEAEVVMYLLILYRVYICPIAKIFLLFLSLRYHLHLFIHLLYVSSLISSEILSYCGAAIPILSTSPKV